MTSQMIGRITDTWMDSGIRYVELMKGPVRHVFKYGSEQQTEFLQQGDWVSLQLNTGHEITTFTRLGGSLPGQWSHNRDGLRWRRVTSHIPRMILLQRRQEILRAIRDSLYSQEFLEIETPLLVKGTCPDTHIDSISTSEGYLVTSTEYQIKRLIVGGFEKVFTLTKNFRAGDRGKHHSSEFTMIEWARAFESLDQIEEDAVRFIRQAFTKLFPGQKSLVYLQDEIEILGKPWERLTVKEAFRNYLGLEGLHDFSLENLLESCKNAGLIVPSHFEQDKHWAITYLLDQVQPHLGRKTPTFLRDWPAYMTSSAQVNPNDPHLAKRSELYIAGIEIADGFPFLQDAHAQKISFERELKRRQDEDKPHVAIDEKYLEALAEGMPPGAGMALGVDRLVMVLTGSTQIGDVQAFSWDEI